MLGEHGGRRGVANLVNGSSDAKRRVRYGLGSPVVAFASASVLIAW